MNFKPFIISLIFLSTILSSCSQDLPAQGNIKINHPEHKEKPYVLLISLDGYRWDYTKRFSPTNLVKKIETGVQAKSMISCFPSKTFPNHYSIATGMYPENHGLVNNSFFDMEKNEVYKIGNRDIVEDGSWYGGTPIWVNAAQAGMVTASFFFVGTEADVQKIRPTYYYRYDGSISNETRVNQIIDWYKMPEESRPHLVTAYFSDMDDVGHLVGPNSDTELSEKLNALDNTLGKLFRGLDDIDLPINVIFVSDHGMAPVPVSQLLPIESIEDEDRYQTVNVGAIVHLYMNNGVNRNEVYEDLKAKENHFKVYKIEESPFYKTNQKNPRLGDILITPEYGWYFKTVRQIGFAKKGTYQEIGHHGYDPAIQDLHAIFYAFGPAFKNGMTIDPFENIHVYPMICEILGLEVPNEVDGKLDVLKGILK